MSTKSMKLFSRSTDGAVSFLVTGLEGRAYVLQTSTDLKQWVSISTNTTAGGSISFTDAAAANFRQRFYRLKSEQ